MPEISDDAQAPVPLGGDAARAEQQHGLRRHRGDRLLARRRASRCPKPAATRSTGTPAPSSAPGSAASTRSASRSSRGSTRARCGASAARRSSRPWPAAISACVGGLLGLGDQVTTNSSACTTGTEAIVDAFHGARRARRADDRGRLRRVLAVHLGRLRRDARARAAVERQARGGVAADERDGRRLRALVRRGAADGREPVVGAGAGRAHLRRDPRRPRQLRRPAGRRQHDGAEPGGRAALRPGGAGGGGHRPRADRRDQRPPDGDDGRPARGRHVAAGARAGGRRRFPWINSTKSLIGHGLGAAGGIESVAVGARSSTEGSCTARSTARTCTPTSPRSRRSIPHGRSRSRRESSPRRASASATSTAASSSASTTKT